MDLRNETSDDRARLLYGGQRTWWDIREERMVPTTTIYIPFGCPDWGESNGVRNELCTFCALPNAVAGYRAVFHAGRAVPESDHAFQFQRTLDIAAGEGAIHTLMIFNAGSFLAMPLDVQSEIMAAAARRSDVRRIVIEARAPLVTRAALSPLLDILAASKISLTVRIGVETRDDWLRLKVLKKGHSVRSLSEAAGTLRELGVTAGGYALLNPAPGLDPQWTVDEAIDTIDWILDKRTGLGMDEVYFGPTCVGENTPLEAPWRRGEFAPASLHAVLSVLTECLPRHPGRIHLLPFSDTPAFLAVPSNHVPAGLPESLKGARGCDRAYHEMFQKFRQTADPSTLRKVDCSCAVA